MVLYMDAILGLPYPIVGRTISNFELNCQRKFCLTGIKTRHLI